MKIFGREPAVIAAAIQSVLVLLIAFDKLEFIGLETQQDIAIVMTLMAAGFAVYLAYVTSETLLAPVVELAKAGLALGIVYGLNISIEQTALLIAMITAVMGMWQRGSVSPVAVPSFETKVH